MQISDLKALIKECIEEVVKEEFGDEGWMRAVNVREEDDQPSSKNNFTYERETNQGHR